MAIFKVKMKNSRQTMCFFMNEKKAKKVLNNIMIFMLIIMKLEISLTVNDCP